MKHKGPATVPLGSIASVNKDRWEVDCGREADNNGVFDPRYHYEVGSGGASVHAKRSKKGTKGAAGKVSVGQKKKIDGSTPYIALDRVHPQDKSSSPFTLCYLIIVLVGKAEHQHYYTVLLHCTYAIVQCTVL